MLIVIIALLAIVAGVSLGLNLSFFNKYKTLAIKHELAMDNLGKADRHVAKLRVGNNRLVRILTERDNTIRDMSVMMETSMDVPQEGEKEFEKWRTRILDRHRVPSVTGRIHAQDPQPQKLPSVTSVSRAEVDSMIMDRVVNKGTVSLKSLAAVIEVNPEDFEFVKPDPQAVVYSDIEKQIMAIRPNNGNPFTKIPGTAPEPSFYMDSVYAQNAKMPENRIVLEDQLSSYLEWEKSVEEDPQIGTALHEAAEKLTGVDFEGETTVVFPALEPLSIESKES